MTPDTLQHEKVDEDGKSWWPRSFWVPMAFFDNLWTITPPTRLKKGQHCLLHEALNLERLKGGTKTCSLRRRRGGNKSIAKPSRRALANNANEMKNRLKHIEERFAYVFNHCAMTKTTQAELNALHGRMWSAKQQVGELTGFGSADPGSGSEGSGYDSSGSTARKMSVRQHEEAMMETAEELNAIEDLLVDFEKSNDIEDDILANEGMAQRLPGTKEKGLDTTPYWIMRFAVGTHIAVCLMVIIATCSEILLGTTAIVSPPGEPPWIRNQKMRSYKEGNYLHLSNEPLPDWYRLFVAAELPEEHHSSEGEHSSAHDSSADAHRRLNAKVTSGALNDLNAMLPSLNWLAEELKKNEAGIPPMTQASGVANLPTSMPEYAMLAKESAAVPMSGFMNRYLKTLRVNWPALFEPRHLACQKRSSGTAIMALTTRGFGALVHMKNTSSVEEIRAEPFSLAGVGGHGTVVGATWAKSGLRVVTHTGRVLQCLGHGPTDDAWPCAADVSMPPLPVSSRTYLKAAASTERDSGERLAALLFEDMPSTVLLYKQILGSTEWQPSGEMHLPPPIGRAGLHFSNDVLTIVSADGSLHHYPLNDIVQPTFVPAPSAASASREWHSACDSDQGILRLALRQTGPSMWRPELVMDAGKPNVGLVNV